MAHITLSGTLLDPNGDNAVGDKIRFTHKSTTGETVQSAVSVLTIPPNGTYSINLEYGLVLVEYKDITSAQFKNRGVATVNGTNPATSIPELLNAVVPVSSAELIEFQAILADCVTAQTAAETAAAEAAASAAVVLIPVSEVVTLVDGQTLVTFATLTTDNAEFNINGSGIDGRVLSAQDYNLGLTTTTTITLFDSYPAGSIVTLSKNTSASVPEVDRDYVHNEPTLNAAIIAIDLVAGDAVNLAERTTGNGDGAMWDVVLSSSVTENGDNIVQCTGVPTLSLVRRDDWGSVGNLSQTYTFATVAAFKASLIEFPDGKIIHLLDRGADFTKITGVLTANTWNVIASTNISQSIDMTLNETMTTKQFGVLFGVEDTAALQNALDVMAGKGKLVSSNGQIVINPIATGSKGIIIPSKTELYFAYGASWKALNPTDASSYVIMDIRDVQNVMIFNPVLIGDKDEHIGVTGEQGHCINVSETALGNTSNIHIYNPICTKAWGDGIVIRKGHVLHFYNATCTDNRRNGITINKAIDTHFHGDTRCSNTNGIAPEAGFDIEPNDATGDLKNIVIDNLITNNNTGPGLTINIGDFPSGTVDKDVSITIHRHEDNGSVYGCNVEKMGKGATEIINGAIVFGEQLYTKNNLCGVYFNDYSGENSPIITMKNLKIVDPNENDSTSFLFGAGIGIDRKAGSGLTNNIGNCIIENLIIKDTRVVNKMTRGVAGADNDGSGADLENFKIINPIEISGYDNDGDAVHMSWVGMELSDNYFQTARQLAGSLSVTSRAYRKLSSVSAVLFTVTDGITKDNSGMPLTVEALGAGTGGIKFKPKAGRSVFPLSTVAGKYVQSTDRGARLTLELNVDEDTWFITEQIGTWTAEP